MEWGERGGQSRAVLITGTLGTRSIKATQLVMATLGITGLPMPFFFLLACNVSYHFLVPPWQSHATHLHPSCSTITSYRWSPESMPPSSVSFLQHNPTCLISYLASSLESRRHLRFMVQAEGRCLPAIHLSSPSISPSSGKGIAIPSISRTRRKLAAILSPSL